MDNDTQCNFEFFAVNELITRFFILDKLQKCKKAAIIFMNLIKDKCDELDHHPEWTLSDNILKIRLTSHFNKNNVSPVCNNDC